MVSNNGEGGEVLEEVSMESNSVYTQGVYVLRPP